MKNEALKNTLIDTLTKLVEVLDKNEISPEGLFYLNLEIPNLVEEDVVSKDTITCAIGELQDGFNIEEIHFIHKTYGVFPRIRKIVYDGNATEKERIGC